MPVDYCLALCTCPDAESARTVAMVLVERRLAACVNILPGLTSIYAWQGDIETADEHLLFIKTRTEQFDALESAIKHLHPYDIPEIVMLPLLQGSADYLAWISQCVGPAV